MAEKEHMMAMPINHHRFIAYCTLTLLACGGGGFLSASGDVSSFSVTTIVIVCKSLLCTRGEGRAGDVLMYRGG